MSAYHDRMFFFFERQRVPYSLFSRRAQASQKYFVLAKTKMFLNRVGASEGKKEPVRLYCHRRMVRGSSLEELRMKIFNPMSTYHDRIFLFFERQRVQYSLFSRRAQASQKYFVWRKKKKVPPTPVRRALLPAPISRWNSAWLFA